MFVTGPEVVKAVTGEDVTFYELGGSDVHSSQSGVCHQVGETEEETLDLTKKLLSYIPSNNLDEPPSSTEKISTENQKNNSKVIPEKDNEPYDMKKIIETTVDSESFFELQSNWAKNMIVGFGKLNGSSIGLIANQPLFLGGAIDSHASDKAARDLHQPRSQPRRIHLPEETLQLLRQAKDRKTLRTDRPAWLRTRKLLRHRRHSKGHRQYSHAQ